MRTQVFISYSHKDATWLNRLKVNLDVLEDKYPIDVWADTKIQSGERWKDRIEGALNRARVAVLLVSQDFLASDFIKRYELPVLLEAAASKGLTILWVAITPSMVHETEIVTYQATNNPDRPLDSLSRPNWQRELVEISKKIKSAAVNFVPSTDIETIPIEKWEVEGGAVPLDSPFYICRDEDEDLYKALRVHAGIIRVKGSRQVGKTSLLSRALESARKAGAKIIFTDFEALDESELQSLGSLLGGLARRIAEKLALDRFPDDAWKVTNRPKADFEKYIKNTVLGKNLDWVVWALDEADHLFAYSYKTQFFGLLRTWFNARATDPDGPWKRLTLVISYATEPNVILKDKINESPFNVGSKIVLQDFNFDQVAHLNYLYGTPLRNQEEIEEYCSLVGGHPYLVRQGLHQMGKHDAKSGNRNGLEAFKAEGYLGEQPFGDHLRRLLDLVKNDVTLCDAIHNLLDDRRLSDTITFHRLQSAGVIVGDSLDNAKLRCNLYAEYLRRHLVSGNSTSSNEKERG